MPHAAVRRSNVSDRGRLSDVPALFDMALIRVEDERSNGATKGTFLEGAFDILLISVLF